MRCARTRCGIGLIEILIAASIMVVLLVVVGAMLNQTMGIWSRRSAQSMSDMEAALAMQRITADLNRAIQITVGTNGQSIYYVLPARIEGEYTFQVPVAPERGADGQIYVRSFYRNGNSLYSSERAAPLVQQLAGQGDAGNPIFALTPGTTNVYTVALTAVRPTGEGERSTRLVQQVAARNCP